jgi:hypothetical protein
VINDHPDGDIGPSSVPRWSVVDLMTSVVELARTNGLVVEEPVPLRSTNNLVVWLRPSAVVAKVSPAHGGAVRELTIARLLGEAGAPVVAPADGIGDTVHRIGDRDITFWPYQPQDDSVRPGAESVGRALSALHDALMNLGAVTPSRTFEQQITDAIAALDRPGHAPGLPSDDRLLLRQTLSNSLAPLAEMADTGRIIHGSPHRLNILVVSGSPVFIDFETVQQGPVEWDLAHLEPEVAEHYGRPLDTDVLSLCRLLVSATTATWCFDGLDRGPDMGDHARHHLGVVRAASGPAWPVGTRAP